MEQDIYVLNDKLNYMMNTMDSDKERFKSMLSWTGKMIDLTIKERMVKNISPKKAEIWTCDLGENVGCEINKVRPVIIVSNNIGNSKSPITTIVPISNRDDDLPTHVYLSDADFRFLDGTVTGSSLAEQIKVVSKGRLGRKIGELTPEALNRVEASVLVSLGIAGENISMCQ